MRKFEFHLCLIVILIFVGCSDKGKQSHQNYPHASAPSFGAFMKEFTTDSVFQATHIKYPLPYLSYPDDSDQLMKREILKGAWRYVDFSDDSLGSTRAEDAFEVVIDRRDSSNLTYSLKGIDNGILIEYEFQIENDEWRLVKVTDASD